jgi:tetratricopeptide (TPR) repeat protein
MSAQICGIRGGDRTRGTITGMSAEDHYYRALDLLAEGRLEEALAAYRQALDEQPDFTDALHGLAQACLRLGRPDEAIAACRRITELQPDDPLAFTGLSQAYHAKGLLAEAEAAGARARALSWKQQLKAE